VIGAVFVTHSGAVRRENQDALLIANSVKTGDMNSCETYESSRFPACFAVIDGMGGHEGGALASFILAETFAEACDADDFGEKFNLGEDEKTLKKILKKASERMYFEARKNPALSEMGAALAGLLIRENTTTAFNCGDCRAYRKCGNDIERLTKDHSIVQTLLDLGRITEDEMRTHPRKNIVTSAVTANPEIEPDIYTHVISRIDDDEYFLCSDGVWETIPTDALGGFLAGPMPDSAGKLLDALMTSKCRDNISFIRVAFSKSDTTVPAHPEINTGALR
jgi:protein phosphatase